jgi:Ca-activated chloride channel family protein
MNLTACHKHLIVRLKGVHVLGIVTLLSVWWGAVSAQQTQVYKPNISRVLFVVDGSGSMKQKWENKSKFETARELLYKLIDSVERKNPNVEFAVRVFGYQNPRDQHNCKDSKLVVPFARNNAAKIYPAMDHINPQGMSPIAYSIQLGAGDFPADEHALNSLVLITDGEETCGGDPCKAAKDLAAKKISLKPFIVGLNIDAKSAEKFNCVGTFFNTKDDASFYNAVGVIIKQTLNTTTAQVNLLDQNGNPTVSNIPFTLYDHYSGKIEYNFIHTLNEKGNPDTLFLDPVGIYDIELHTFPSIRKEGIELVPGKHNIIALDVPAGDVEIACNGASISTNDAQVLLRMHNDPRHILNAQDLNTQVKYLQGNYKYEILTVPECYMDTVVTGFADNKYKLPGYGTLSLMANENFLASIYTFSKGVMQLVERFDITARTANYKLQPGDYSIVYKAKNNYRSESTRSQKFVIEEGKMVVLTL